MTLYEALQDIGKGRFYNNGCDYTFAAVAKGTYFFTFPNDETIEITVDGKQSENAWNLEKEYYKKAYAVNYNMYHNRITKAEYKPLRKAGTK